MPTKLLLPKTAISDESPLSGRYSNVTIAVVGKYPCPRAWHPTVQSTGSPLAIRYSLFAKSAIEPCLDPLGQRLQLLGGVVGPHLLGTASRESRLQPGSGPPAATRASAVRPARQRAMVQQKYGHLCPGFAGACGMGALKVWHALRRQRQPYAYHSAAKKWHALPSRTSRCQTKCEYRMRSSKRNTTAPSV